MDKETENRSRVFVNTKYHYDTYIDDTQLPCDAGDGHRLYVGNSLQSVLETYDSDTNDKTLRFNGYQEDMDGKWYRVMEDGQSIYYFERGKVNE